MCLLLLLLASALSGPVSYRDVSDRFDLSLGRMLKELRDGGEDFVAVGTLLAGDYLIVSARMGNLTTIRRTSQASLVGVGGGLSIEGGLALGEMVLEGSEAHGSGGLIPEPRVTVRENFWNYNFLMRHDSFNCSEGVVVLSTDLGEAMLSSEGGPHERDVTHWVKHHMTDALRRAITGAIAGVFEKHFDFCNLLKY